MIERQAVVIFNDGKDFYCRVVRDIKWRDSPVETTGAVRIKNKQVPVRYDPKNNIWREIHKMFWEPIKGFGTEYE